MSKDPFCSKEEWYDYVDQHINPNRLNSGLDPMSTEDCDECWKTLSGFFQGIRNNPLVEKKHSLFIGHEVEGPERGTVTLFVPSGSPAINPREIRSHLRENPDIRRVYFGAGYETGLNPAHCDVAVTLIRMNYRIVIEIIDVMEIEHAPDFLKRSAYIVHTSYTDAKPMQGVYIDGFKIVAQQDMDWYDIATGKRYHNFLSDPMYDGDEEL